MTNLVRPTSINEVLSRLERFSSPEAQAVVDRFATRPSDVFICTYTKSGTTWLQQIVHQVRTGGSMEFQDISVVVPWLETALDCNIDPSADQPWTPRAFKSHLSAPQIPHGGRYITAFRDPRTVLPSFYRFFSGWFFESATVSLEDFARGLYMKGSKAGRHWQHLIDWWPRIGDHDVLALSYEDMLLAPDAVPPLVASFLGIEHDPETMAVIVDNCRRKTMVEHGSKFEEQLMREHRDPVMGLPSGGTASKINATSSNEVSDEILEQLGSIWADVVEPVLGFSNYAQFRAALPDPLNVRSSVSGNSGNSVSNSVSANSVSEH